MLSTTNQVIEGFSNWCKEPKLDLMETKEDGVWIKDFQTSRIASNKAAVPKLFERYLKHLVDKGTIDFGLFKKLNKRKIIEYVQLLLNYKKPEIKLPEDVEYFQDVWDKEFESIQEKKEFFVKRYEYAKEHWKEWLI